MFERIKSGFSKNEIISKPVRRLMHAPLCTLYTRAVPSALAVTRRVPVELKAMSSTY